MKAIVSRVKYSFLEIDNNKVGEIKEGLLVYLGIEKGDENSNADKMVYKILKERIFEDSEGKLNLSVSDKKYDIMIIPNFTVASSTDHGLRPDFYSSESPEKAKDKYSYIVGCLKETGLNVVSGVFGADMYIRSLNAGPVNIILKT